ncbi:uncharacterized protein LOC110835413 isoform X2 [Zootermopsis nevadensis]|uniref:uncharacterized protein LOC110835413 isoform X2 n=1 Tax=Zootermopsis nevadensis TaxID=136037 RepID=UPI000B8EAFB7|nr:uncharacterized protein LOC110835413 isoform X2 [Zootermopsis nevadensis]
MANMDLSLDDIIQKKFSKASNIRGRKRGQGKRLEPGSRGQSLNNTNHVKRRGGRQGGRRGQVLGPADDARLRIIQKNRQKLTDARDKLAEIAKQTDARFKLDKLRENRSNASPNLSRVGASITRRTSRNGQISLSTNKRRIPRNGNEIQERTVTSGGRGFGMPISKMDVDDIEEDLLPAGSTVLRRTVSNDRTSLPPPPLFAPPMQQRSLYAWVNPVSQDSVSSVEEYGSMTRNSIRAPILRDPVLTSPVTRRGTIQPTSLKIIARNTQQLKHGPTLLSEREEWNYEAQPLKHVNVPPVSRIEPEDSDDEDDLSPWKRGSASGSTGMLAGRMSSELKARLDTPVVTPRTMGILSVGSKSSTNTTPSAPTGHRIVVSNLQTSVTHEDIRELFEDIGPLVTSRLVRPGTAEVVYQLHKDAVKAVDVYHNRQLDGQPMKCMLVNSRPPSISSAGRNSASSRSSSGNLYKLPTGGKSSVIPDIGTIHKALFNKS